MGIPILSATLFAPLAGALLILAIPREKVKTIRRVGIAFAIKVPSCPFHSWLPDAHTEAPTADSVILAGIMLKLGAYGLTRITLPLLPGLFHYFIVQVPIIPVMAVVSIACGALVCMAQWDLKRLIA